MQAFKVETDKHSKFYFCCLECAQKHNFGVTHGEFVTERDYHRQEICANCDIFLNNTTRSFTAHHVSCGQDKRDAAILAEANLEMLTTLEALLPYLPDRNDALNFAATNDGQASNFQVAAIRAREVVARNK